MKKVSKSPGQMSVGQKEATKLRLPCERKRYELLELAAYYLCVYTTRLPVDPSLHWKANTST
jgi:hypothetical protein